MEYLGKITQGGKAQQLSNLGHGKIRFSQQVLAFVDASCDHIVDRREAVFLFEGMGEIEFIHMSFLSQLFQCQRFFEVKINISPDGSTLSVGRNCLRFGGDSKGSTSHEPDNQDLHIGLANIFVSGIFLLHFPKNISQAAGDLYTFEMIQNVELSVGVIICGKLNTADTKNDIFKRLCI